MSSIIEKYRALGQLVMNVDLRRGGYIDDVTGEVGAVFQTPMFWEKSRFGLGIKNDRSSGGVAGAISFVDTVPRRLNTGVGTVVCLRPWVYGGYAAEYYVYTDNWGCLTNTPVFSAVMNGATSHNVSCLSGYELEKSLSVAFRFNAGTNVQVFNNGVYMGVSTNGWVPGNVASTMYLANRSNNGYYSKAPLNHLAIFSVQLPDVDISSLHDEFLHEGHRVLP